MKCRLVFAVIATFLLASAVMFAQEAASESSPESSADAAYWVSYWGRPRLVLFGPEEEAFNKNIHELVFPWNDHDEPSNTSALDDNVQWLKDHPSDRFYIEGYASSRGELIYNLALSQRRADWVKQALISKGIPENRIVVAAGWGQLYPVCPELNDECWGKNRVVRLSYSPH
jgi:outer membrane protein OmpA-like peptidoglycan-associated protein